MGLFKRKGDPSLKSAELKKLIEEGNGEKLTTLLNSMTKDELRFCLLYFIGDTQTWEFLQKRYNE